MLRLYLDVHDGRIRKASYELTGSAGLQACASSLTTIVEGMTVEQAKGSKQVTNAISRIAETVQQIAFATAEQAKGAEHIMQSAERMKVITQQVERSSDEQNRGGEQVTGAIENITAATDAPTRTIRVAFRPPILSVRRPAPGDDAAASSVPTEPRLPSWVRLMPKSSMRKEAITGMVTVKTVAATITHMRSPPKANRRRVDAITTAGCIPRG